MNTDHIQVAERLRDAYRAGAIQPPREWLAPNDSAAAYAVQAVNTQFWTDGGRRIVGRKIGLTAKAVQAQLGVDQPDYGVLFADMQVPNGGNLDATKLIQAKAEAEIALILGQDVDFANATPDGIAEAADCAVAAIEIVDSRIADWKISFADTVADNGSSAYFVLGSERRSLAGLDLYTCGMALLINGEIVSVGAGAACLGHPLNAAAWLARTLAAHGTPLRAGDIVLTGALGPMVALASGDRVEARIGGVGTTAFNFV